MGTHHYLRVQWHPVAVLCTFSWLASSTLIASDGDIYEKRVLPFFAKHCRECHTGEKAAASFRIDGSIPVQFADASVRSQWAEVVNVLNSHEMPPEDKPQPDQDQVAAVVDWITDQIVQAEMQQRENAVVLRRLNRNEFKNTIRDLVGVEFDVAGFPQDPPASGFDNIGSALSMSPMQLELYLDAAKKIMDLAMVDGPRPESIRWRFEIDSGDSDSNRIKIDDQNPIVNGGENPVINGFKRVHHDSWNKVLNVRDFAVKHAGLYMIRIRAAGKIASRDQVVASAEAALDRRLEEQMRENPKGEKWHRQARANDLEHFKSDRRYDYGPVRMKLIQDLGGQPLTITELDVPEDIDNAKIYEVPVYFTTQRAGVSIQYAYSIPRSLENFWMQGNDSFARPELFVDWIEIEGPVYPSWPPPSHKLLVPETIQDANDTPTIEKTIGRFVRRAFRRPITRTEAAPYLAIYTQAKSQGLSINDSLKSAFAAVLISPNFLYIIEDQAKDEDIVEKSSKLTCHQIANRMSYFLWSSMPDKELMSIADSGKLIEPNELRKQTARMLADPRSEQFVRNFTDQWLGLREVGANPPAMDLYPHYDRHLELSMIEEGRALFRTILRDGRNVLDFIDPDYVVINERLARFYEIDGVRGDEFRVVPVTSSSHRGGILNQTAMLTITSNGTRTSPVKRGTWILKNVLGTDPGLPVANAGDIAPKVPGIDKATVRQRLEMHRELTQCARCHNKIDPLGLALENYDASGHYREQEGFGYQGRIQRDDPRINPSSKLPDGTSIAGPAELKKALRSKEDAFLKCLTEKMLTYALGRETTLADQPTIRTIVARVKQQDYRLDALVQSIIQSEAFQQY